MSDQATIVSPMQGVNSQQFRGGDYLALAQLFHTGYPGYKPDVVELPNGDGKADVAKRYLHVATKYAPPLHAADMFYAAFGMACVVAEALGLPPSLRPSVNACALRVLEYPAGAGSELHTDFDMFTLNLWRSEPVPGMEARTVAGCSVHLGELGEIFGLGKAEPHSVPALDHPQQSLVFFALPDPSVELPLLPRFSDACGNRLYTVGQWLAERYARSRGYK